VPRAKKTDADQPRKRSDRRLHASDDALARLRERVAAREGRHRQDPLARPEGFAADTAVVEALARVGMGTWRAWSLRDYDAERYGPVFGVSDDGRNAQTIVSAFLDSPKSRVLRDLGDLSLETVGACVDAERMSAAGELPVGPDEFGRVYAAAAGRIAMSTNVGTVVLPRFFRPDPFVTYRPEAPDPIGAVIADTKALLTPYMAASGAPARAVVAYVFFRSQDRISKDHKVAVLSRLRAAIESGEIGDAGRHSIGLLQRAHDRNSTAPRFAIDVAVDAGLREVRIEGRARLESQDQLLLPGLLAFFEPKVVKTILAYAQTNGIHIQPKNSVDPDTAARTVWAGITAARTMGAQLGKFGLFPLTLEQQAEAMQSVSKMVRDWTATPAFYADRPLVGKLGLYQERDAVDALEQWLAAAGGSGFAVVLIDAPDRTPWPGGTARRAYHEDRGRRLIKRGPSDRDGIFEFEDVDRIRKAAARHGLRVMWAGGLDGDQVFKLAWRGEFALFTTTATARRVPVRGRVDPSMATRLQPTHNGVLGAKMIVEAGFLAGRAAARGDATAEGAIRTAAAPVIEGLDSGQLAVATTGPLLDAMHTLAGTLEPVWRQHFAGTTP